MTSGRRIEELLERAPTRPLKRRLYRVVPALSYLRSARPIFLYTSGRPNRCNPAEVDCLYFSETETTALEEYLQGVAGTKAQHAPRLTFLAEADCGTSSATWAGFHAHAFVAAGGIEARVVGGGART